MNRIYINGRFLTQQITGVQRYALEIVRTWDLNFQNWDIGTHCRLVILTPAAPLLHDPDFGNIPIRTVGNLKGHLWEQMELPFYTRDGVLINLCNTGPILKRNQTVTIHDAAVFTVPQAFSFIFRTWYRRLLPILGARARRIITDSVFSQKELVRFCDIPRERLDVIYLGKEHMIAQAADDSIIKAYNLPDKRYVLAVSSLSPNKNFGSIVKALDLLQEESLPVVITGGVNPKVFRGGNLSLPSNIRYVGYVSDPQLRALYEHAGCFVYPSFYEGFGLPPLEAMALGCPVIVSNAASLPEVCGPAALYCDPHNPRDIAAKIKLVMNNPALRSEQQEKAMKQASLFTWEKCAAQLWSMIKDEFNLENSHGS